MFTSIDKAIAAAVMAAIFFANYFFNTGITVTPEAVNGFLAVVTPLLVYFIPNKKA